MTIDATDSVRVWDLPTRFFHWLLVVAVLASLATGKFDSLVGPDTLEWHRRSGYLVLALLVFRLGWGLVGGTHARFARFVRAPAAVAAYARALVRGEAGREPVGHNPLGGYSVVAMLAVLLAQVGTGLFLVQEDYAFEAPLAKHVSRAVSDRLGDLHEKGFWLIAALVLLHLAAVAFYTLVKRQSLVGAMLTGRKRLPAGHAAEASQGGGVLAGLLLALASAVAVWALVTFA